MSGRQGRVLLHGGDDLVRDQYRIGDPLGVHRLEYHGVQFFQAVQNSGCRVGQQLECVVYGRSLVGTLQISRQLRFLASPIVEGRRWAAHPLHPAGGQNLFVLHPEETELEGRGSDVDDQNLHGESPIPVSRRPGGRPAGRWRWNESWFQAFRPGKGVSMGPGRRPRSHPTRREPYRESPGRGCWRLRCRER